MIVLRLDHWRKGFRSDRRTWTCHDDVIKRKHFPHYWPFVRGFHWSLVVSPHKWQRCGWSFDFFLYPRGNAWANNRNAGDLRPPSRSLWRHCNGVPKRSITLSFGGTTSPNTFRLSGLRVYQKEWLLVFIIGHFICCASIGTNLWLSNQEPPVFPLGMVWNQLSDSGKLRKITIWCVNEIKLIILQFSIYDT